MGYAAGKGLDNNYGLLITTMGLVLSIISQLLKRKER